jgi:hypothetical protein
MYYIYSKYCRIAIAVKSIGFIYLLLLCAGCEQAFEYPIADKQVQLLAPANAIITADSVHTFYWETMEGATWYQIQIVSPGFGSIARLAIDTVIAGNQFVQKLRRPDGYEWRVRALNNEYTSRYSDVFKLTIQ